MRAEQSVRTYVRLLSADNCATAAAAAAVRLGVSRRALEGTGTRLYLLRSSQSFKDAPLGRVYTHRATFLVNEFKLKMAVWMLGGSDCQGKRSRQEKQQAETTGTRTVPANQGAVRSPVPPPAFPSIPLPPSLSPSLPARFACPATLRALEELWSESILGARGSKTGAVLTFVIF